MYAGAASRAKSMIDAIMKVANTNFDKQTSHKEVDTFSMYWVEPMSLVAMQHVREACLWEFGALVGTYDQRDSDPCPSGGFMANIGQTQQGVVVLYHNLRSTWISFTLRTVCMAE